MGRRGIGQETFSFATAGRGSGSGDKLSGLIDEKNGVGSWCDGLGDFHEMEAHRLGIAGRQDQGRAFARFWAYGTEDVGRCGALIPWGTRASAALRPPAGDLVLLANARLVGEPDFFCGCRSPLHARLYPSALRSFFIILDGSLRLRIVAWPSG